MFILRRAAARAISQQPSRQLSTLRITSTRSTLLQTTKPTLYRPFTQTRIWRAEQQEEKVEALQEEATAAADHAHEAAEAGESNVAQSSAEAAQEAADEAAVEAAANPEPAEPAYAQASNTHAEQLASQAQAAAQAAASTASPSAPGSSQFPPRQAPSSFPPRDTGPSQAGTSFRNAQPSRILYIGNLFFEVTAAQLEAEFSRYGTITNSRVVTDARGLSKGFGYIEFDTQQSADQAVKELDQKVFQGRRMAVQYHVRRETRRGFGQQKDPNPPSKTLFIGNMSYQMSDRDLNDLFREIRDVLDVRVAIDRRSGQPRGFAHADFIDVPSAQRAKEHLEKKVVYGRQLRVDFSQSSSATQNV